MTVTARHVSSVFASALAVRVIHVFANSHTPFFDGPVIDSNGYLELAKQVVLYNDWGPAFYQPPLYPAVWALFLSIGMGHGWKFALWHCIAGSLASSLFYVTGYQWALRSGFDSARSVALLCGFGAALYGPLIFYDTEYMPSVWVELLLLSAWNLCLSARRGPSIRDAFCGLCTGLASVGWVLSSVLLGVTVLSRAREQTRWKERIVVSVIMAAAASLPVVVVAHHNAEVGEPGVLVSWNGGLNFWLGNNPNWRDTWKARPGPEFEREFERPELAGIASGRGRDAFFYAAGFADIVARPLPAVLRTAEKFYYVWHGREIRRDRDFLEARRASPVLRMLMWEHGVLFPFGIVVPFAALGAWRRRWEPTVQVTILGCMLYSSLLAAYIVSARYRLPLLIWLLPLASQEVVWVGGCWSWSRACHWLLATVLLNFPNEFTASFRATSAEAASLRVFAWMARGEYAAAESESGANARRWPDDPLTQSAYGQVLQARGKCVEAIPYLSKAVALAPDLASPLVGRANCYSYLRLYDEAALDLQRALDLNPLSSTTLKGAAMVSLDFGRREEAKQFYQRFSELGYRDRALEGAMRRGRIRIATRFGEVGAGAEAY